MRAEWIRESAVSGGKVVVRPITSEGWITLLLFVAVLTIALLAIWFRLFLTGSVGVLGAVMMTILVKVVVITVFVLV